MNGPLRDGDQMLGPKPSGRVKGLCWHGSFCDQALFTSRLN